MGFKYDIECAFYSSMYPDKSCNEVSDGEKVNIPQLADKLVDAFKKFLSEQTWEITEFKAFVELDQFETTDTLAADIGIPFNGQTASWPGGATGPLQPVAIPKTTGVVSVPKIVFTKEGTNKPFKGGSLNAVGYAYLGNPIDKPKSTRFDTKSITGDGWNDFAKVKINIDDIDTDYDSEV